MDSKDIIVERDKTHGDYDYQSKLSQEIKNVFKSSYLWNTLSYNQKESLEMIAVKISRILNGNPNFKDHWDDISGYAELISESLK